MCERAGALPAWPTMVQRLWVSRLLRHRKAQLLLVNLLTFGLEVCLAAGITCVPPLLLEVGVEEKFMTMVLGIGPVLGLVSVPLLGSASDHWRGRYGRRRPFIWALSLGVLLSLFLIPRAGRLAGLLCPDTRPLELALLILGVGLLDFCGQVCFTPLEALLSDLFRDPDHCRQAFSVYAFMISLGGCLGYLLPAIDWDASALAPYLGTQEECLFGLLTVIFLTCVAGTLFVAEEAVLGPAEPAEGLSAPSMPPRCCPCHARLAFRNLGALFPQLHQLCCRVPRTLRRLFVAELCSWMAFMTFTLFYTDFVGEGLYQGVPRAELGTEARRHYDEDPALHASLPLPPREAGTHMQVFLPKYRGDAGGGTSEDSLMTSFPPGPKAGSAFPNGHVGAGGSGPLPSPPVLCGASACDVSMRMVVGEPPEARVVPGRGICLDLAILDSAFLLSQVAPSLFMGSIVQLSQSVTAYMVSAAGLGLVAIYFATQDPELSQIIHSFFSLESCCGSFSSQHHQQMEPETSTLLSFGAWAWRATPLDWGVLLGIWGRRRGREE
ncbi:solute carrier family 45 member 3 isoform X3 [Diceros bicornis minor]|uniref:solute carrier family 45 member 3 isoform X3 n=1 Tax=Diceros bicornis minor TaxID=77932 RepID=UPI0026F2CEA5|nr:solute carrier family 45 member 3 isoform X3 [Diceros bicornis minor]